MSLALGNLAGAINAIQTGFSGETSLKKFLSTMDKVGVQITSRYEAVFSAIPQTMFFIQDISTPGIKQNVTNLYFDGRVVEIPQNFEYEHEFQMTVINDASGYIYTALTTLMMGDSESFLTNSGYSMSIRSIGDDNHDGSTMFLNGVRLKSIGSLHYQNGGGDVQTFTLGCSAIDFSVTPGSVRKIAGATSAIGKMIS